jgi:small subunit ribosomal protein S24e
MELEIIERKENPFLDRIELRFKLRYDGAPVPPYGEINKELASQLNADKELIVIDKIEPTTGKSEAKGYAKIYKSVEGAKAIERKHILIKNKLLEKEKPKK